VSVRANVTVADVVIDGLVRAGGSGVLAVVERGAAGPLTAAARSAGVRVVALRSPHVAAVMAAVTGDLGDIPGVVAMDAADTPAAGPALAGAAAGRSPLLLVTGDGLAPAPVKASLALTPESAAHGTAHALHLALTHPRGPVHLVVTPDIIARAAWPVATVVRPAPALALPIEALDEAARRVGAAARPVLVLGLQCRAADAPRWLRALAEALPAPVLVTPRARGVVPDPHPLNLGSVERGSDVLGRADLVVAIGLDVQEAAALPAAPIVHLGATSLARADWAPAHEVLGDVSLIVAELAPRLRSRPRADWDVAEVDRLKRARSAPAPRPARLTARRVVEIARAATPAGAVATADATPWGAVVAAAWQSVVPGDLCVATGPELTPFAVPAALAARLVAPEAPAIAFTDAGGLERAADALEAAARLGVAVAIVVGGDGAQAALALAPRLGAAGTRADTEDDVLGALGRAWGGQAPVVIALLPDPAPASPV
jgi:acetolactate synthase-1/2/3 large subunit